MKRKGMVMLLLSAALALSLCACGGTQGSASGDTERLQEGTTQNNAISEEVKKDIEVEGINTAATIEETILVDERDIKITAMELDYTNYSVDLKLTIENNSEQEMSFVSGSMGYSSNAVNGYMISDGYMNADIPAGKKANESISFSKDALVLYGITEIADIQIGFEVKDSNHDDVYKGVAQVKTSVAESYDYETDTYQKSITSGVLEAVYDCRVDYYAEDEIYNQGNISIVSEAFLTNVDGEKMLLLEVVNRSSDYINGTVSDISVNGLTVKSGSWSSDSINPGAHCIIDLSISSLFDASYWDIFGISDIGLIALSFAVDDFDYNEIISPERLQIVMADSATVDDSGEELYQDDKIRIVSKGIVEDSFDYSDDLHMLFLCENTSSSDLKFDVVYDSLSINGFMVDEITFGVMITGGGMGVIDVQIMARSLEENSISGIEDITEAELTFEVENKKYNTVAEPTVVIKY